MTTAKVQDAVAIDEALVAWPARRPRNFNPRIPNSNNIVVSHCNLFLGNAYNRVEVSEARADA